MEKTMPIKIDPGSLKRRPAMRAADRIRVHGGEVPYLTFPLLEEQTWCRHAFSTRAGGISTGALSSMNLSFAREKNRSTVEANFRIFADALGFPPEHMVLSHQTHTTNIRVVTAADRGKGFLRERDYRDIDGLVTDCPDIVLVTFYGDCVPLLAVDPVHHVIGSAHSGWRGTLNNIGAELIRTMRETYGTNPADVRAAIGPSICPDCFEVGPEVAEAFLAERGTAFSEPILRRGNIKDGEQKYQLDLQEACRRNFLGAGLKEEHISLPDLCTCCNWDVLFSHRGSGGEHGLMAAFLWM